MRKETKSELSRNEQIHRKLSFWKCHLRSLKKNINKYISVLMAQWFMAALLILIYFFTFIVETLVFFPTCVLIKIYAHVKLVFWMLIFQDKPANHSIWNIGTIYSSYFHILLCTQLDIVNINSKFGHCFDVLLDFHYLNK